MNQQQQSKGQSSHVRVSHGSDSRVVVRAKALETAGEMVKEHGSTTGLTFEDVSYESAATGVQLVSMPTEAPGPIPAAAICTTMSTSTVWPMQLQPRTRAAEASRSAAAGSERTPRA